MSRGDGGRELSRGEEKRKYRASNGPSVWALAIISAPFWILLVLVVILLIGERL